MVSSLVGLCSDWSLMLMLLADRSVMAVVRVHRQSLCHVVYLLH